MEEAARSWLTVKPQVRQCLFRPTVAGALTALSLKHWAHSILQASRLNNLLVALRCVVQNL